MTRAVVEPPVAGRRHDHESGAPPWRGARTATRPAAPSDIANDDDFDYFAGALNVDLLLLQASPLPLIMTFNMHCMAGIGS